jgi:hypothetical protein
MHNVAIFLNQTAIFLTIIFLLSEIYFPLAYEIERLLLYGMFAMIATVLFLSLTRTIYTIWQNYGKSSP